MQKILQFVSYLTIILTLGLIGVVAYWLIYPYEPITFTQPHVVLNKEVARGEHVLYRVDYCKNVNSIPIVTKTFVDSILYAVPEIVATEKFIGCGSQVVSMYVPKALLTGEFYIEIVYHYQVNPIRTIDVVSKTERFTIVK